MVICPAGAFNVPVLITFPPIKVKVCPWETVSSPELTILPGLDVEKRKLLGSPERLL